MSSFGVLVIGDLVVLRRESQSVELRGRVKWIGSRSDGHGGLGCPTASHSSTESRLFPVAHVQEDESCHETEYQEDESDEKAHGPVSEAADTLIGAGQSSSVCRSFNDDLNDAHVAQRTGAPRRSHHNQADGVACQGRSNRSVGTAVAIASTTATSDGSAFIQPLSDANDAIHFVDLEVRMLIAQVVDNASVGALVAIGSQDFADGVADVGVGRDRESVGRLGELWSEFVATLDVNLDIGGSRLSAHVAGLNGQEISILGLVVKDGLGDESAADWVDLEVILAFAAGDAVFQFPVLAAVDVVGVGCEDDGADGSVLGDEFEERADGESGSVVVFVLHFDGDGSDGRQRLRAVPIAGPHDEPVLGRRFKVEWLLQRNDAGRRVHFEAAQVVARSDVVAETGVLVVVPIGSGDSQKGRTNSLRFRHFDFVKCLVENGRIVVDVVDVDDDIGCRIASRRTAIHGQHLQIENGDFFAVDRLDQKNFTRVARDLECGIDVAILDRVVDVVVVARLVAIRGGDVQYNRSASCVFADVGPVDRKQII